MSIAKRDEDQGDEIVPGDLGGDIGEHEGAESEAFIVESPALREELEAVDLKRTYDGRNATH
jgi:hypothetical protein